MDIFNDQEAIYYLNSNALAIPEITTLARYVEKGILTPCFYYVGTLNRTIIHHDELKKAVDVKFEGYVTPHKIESRHAFYKCSDSNAIDVLEISIKTLKSYKLVDDPLNYIEDSWKSESDHTRIHSHTVTSDSNFEQFIHAHESIGIDGGIRIVSIQISEKDRVYLKSELDEILEDIKSKKKEKPANFEETLKVSDDLRLLVNDLFDQVQRLKSEVQYSQMDAVINECCNPDHPAYAPELHNAVLIWRDLYLNGQRKNGQIHSDAVSNWVKQNENRLVNLTTKDDNSKVEITRYTKVTMPYEDKKKTASKIKSEG